MSVDSGGDRTNSFDALRLFAALCVFYSHQIAFIGLPEPQLGPLGISLASTGLYIFFALSGYLVFKSIARHPDPVTYFRARALRIFPGAIANTLFCIGLGAVITTLSLTDFITSKEVWSYLFHNGLIVITPTAFELPGVLKNARWPVVNGSIWTIKYELACYVVLFLAVTFARIVSFRAASLLCIVTGILLVAYVSYISLYPNPPAELFFNHYNRFNAIRFLMTFFAGALVAACDTNDDRRTTAQLWFFIIPSALIVFGPTPHFARAGIILLLVVLLVEIGKTRWFFSKTYQTIGDLSYGIFLYAYPIQNAVVTRFYDGNNFLIITVWCTAMIVGAAFLSWHLIERPFLALKSKPSSGRTEQRPAL